jgi:glyoxylase-like metal-dependent hydrolase (beta-lactamase superfamily II)
MEMLWGEVAPVPEQNLHPLSGGEEVLGFRVNETLGHASHHVSYFHPESGCAFVGDMAAVRIPPGNFVIPPTPPPDIDIEAWEHSIDKILDWGPDSLGLAHFGEVSDPDTHMQIVRVRLREQAARAKSDDAAEFERRLREDVEREAPDMETAEALLQAVPPEQQFYGLDRYWSKREDG